MPAWMSRWIAWSFSWTSLRVRAYEVRTPAIDLYGGTPSAIRALEDAALTVPAFGHPALSYLSHFRKPPCDELIQRRDRHASEAADGDAGNVITCDEEVHLRAADTQSFCSLLWCERDLRCWRQYLLA